MTNGPSLLRMDDLRAKTGLSRSDLYRRIKSNRFPRPIIIPDSSIRAWRSDEVQAWVDHTIATASRDDENK
jgi:prophage regulatory protein